MPERETYKHAVHVVLSVSLMIAASVLFNFSRTDNTLKQIDTVRITQWNKPTTNLDAMKAAVDVAPFFTDADPQKCRNMSAVWGFPTVVWNASTTPSNCTIKYVVAYSASLVNGILVTAPAQAPSCIPGSYSISLFGGNLLSANNSYKLSLSLTISGAPGSTQTFTVGSSGEFGGTWDAMGNGYNACSSQRNTTATWINANASCLTEASQMCTCIYTITQRLSNATAQIAPTPGMPAAVKESLDICTKWRRVHDVRTVTDNPISIIQTFLMFALALALNSFVTLLKPFMPRGTDRWTMGYHFFLFLAYWTIFVLTTHLSGTTGGGSTFSYIMLLTWLPAMFISFYYEFMFVHRQLSERPYLCPGTFAICLCTLVTSSLLNRGIHQWEFIFVELFKCHVIAILYLAAVWYYIYQKEHQVSQKSPHFQHAYLLLLTVALSASLDSYFFPYPVRGMYAGSRLIELMPFLFTLVSFMGVGLLSLLNLTQTLQRSAGPDGLEHAFYHDITAFSIFFLGMLFFYQYLTRHMQVYNSRQGNYGFPFLSTFVGPKTIPSQYVVPGYIRTTTWI